MKVILPFYGEFGHLIMKHVRYCYNFKGDNMVCCYRGDECLFPNATDFYYDWVNPVPDWKRNGDMSGCKDAKRYDKELRARLAPLDCIRAKYNESIKTTFRPVVENHLTCDIAISTRKRIHDANRNWKHWEWLIKELQARGYRIGITGTKNTSVAVEGCINAWNHPLGHTSGTVDLLNHCKLYIGSDTGVTHLAGLMGIKSLVFHHNQKQSTNYLAKIQGINKQCRIIEAWNNPENILDYINTV